MPTCLGAMRAATLFVLLSIGVSIAIADEANKSAIDLPAETLDKSLRDLALQTNSNITYEPSIVSGLKAPKIQGQLTTLRALSVILSHTQLEVVRLNNATYQIIESTVSPSSGNSTSLDAITVTGTHIRGAIGAVGEELIVIDRDSFTRNGFTTVDAVVQSLPQNFLGGVRTDNATNPTSQGSTNSENEFAPNLRGLGGGATLVLLDGRRLAPGGGAAAYTGVSSIPLSAIERIEVLPDGASALYGSDAVGGVINIITRSDYEGAESSARYGSVDRGGLSDLQLSQVFGKHWDSGRAMIDLEYEHANPMQTNARDQAGSNLTSYGGSNFDTNQCNPGTLIVGSQTYALPHGQAGTQNLCDRNAGNDLYPEQKRWNFLATVQQHVSDAVLAFADFSFADRKLSNRFGSTNTAALLVPSTNPFYVNPTGGTDPVTVEYNLTRDIGPNTSETDAKYLNAAFGATFALPNEWSITGYLGGSQERQSQVQFLGADPTLLNAALADTSPVTALNPFGEGANTNPVTLGTLRQSEWAPYSAKSKLWLANATADGPLFSVPGGTVRIAVGVDYRKQLFDSTTQEFYKSEEAPIVNLLSSLQRSIHAVFGELLVPIFGPGNQLSGAERLTLSFAGRYEKYSDFGSTSVPKIGTTWQPTDGVTVHSSWSKSFQAPALPELDTNNNFTYITTSPNSLAPSGVSPILILGGNNAQLGPETARTWTLGVDYAPPAFHNFKIGATYFDIAFANQIAGLPNTNYFGDPVNAPAIDRNPTASERQAACSTGTYYGNFSAGTGDCLTAPIDAIVDTRLRNLASVRERGVDANGNFSALSNFGTWSFAVDATYLFSFSQSLTPAAPAIDLASTVGYPIDLKLRGSVGWRLREIALNGIVNFSNAYRNPTGDPPASVRSWTTVDFNATYNFGRETGFLANSQVSLNIQNILDSDPPFVNNPVGIGYDQFNATLMGRFISLAVKKAF